MHLLLIRHGQSSNNVVEAAHGAGESYDKVRNVDPSLSSLGERQAELLGQHLGAQLRRSKHRVRLICSSMTRAMQTIRPLARTLGLTVAVRPEFHEVKGFYDTNGYKVYGKGKAQLEATFPGYDVSLVPECGQSGESCDEALARAHSAVKFLREMARGNEEDIVVVVSHNDFIGLLGRMLLFPSAADPDVSSRRPEDIFTESYLCMNNTGISHFVLGLKPPPGSYPNDTWLMYWNRSDHLQECTRSGINFKNVGFVAGAEWSRVGEGGSGLKPTFEEVNTFQSAVDRSSRRWMFAAAVTAFGVGIGVGVFSMRARR